MQTIPVIYPSGEYPIYVGQNLFRDNSLLSKHITGKQVMVITNETIAALYLPQLLAQLTAYQLDSLVLPDGEKYKTLEYMSRILDALIANKHHRDTTLIALGGGVIGDMVGFAAACFHRGVAFIQIPTSLLAQVDASIGGKTAVNHPLGKNLIGAFHQPQAVLIDIDVLTTLKTREYQAGLAEIIKSALIRDAEFFVYLEKHIHELLQRNSAILLATIVKACTIKRDIVAIDEKEQNIRALLNLGHTFAHAIEQNQAYSVWLHGEAVAVGMVLAAVLSYQLGWLNAQELLRVVQILHTAGLPTTLPVDCDFEKLIAAMYADKKILANQLRLIVLQQIGHAVITTEVDEQQIRDLLTTAPTILKKVKYDFES